MSLQLPYLSFFFLQFIQYGEHDKALHGKLPQTPGEEDSKSRHDKLPQ
jgi:hypothetical protein